MFARRAPAAVVRLFVAVLVGSGGPESRGPSAAATVDSCRRQPLPDVDVGYACDVIVTSSSSDGAVTATTIEVPRDAAALRLTLRRAPASHVTSQTGSGRWTTSLPHLRSVEVGEIVSRQFAVLLYVLQLFDLSESMHALSGIATSYAALHYVISSNLTKTEQQQSKNYLWPPN